MRISDWSSDVCSSDLLAAAAARQHREAGRPLRLLRAPLLSRCRAALHRRVADEGRCEAVALEVGRLEGQQHQQAVEGAGNLFRAPWLPGPDLRALGSAPGTASGRQYV